MKERAYPEGHPASEDFDPDSPEAKAWQAHHDKVVMERDYPPGHPAASDTPAEKVGDHYRAKFHPEETTMRSGGVAFRSQDVLIVACPLHGDRQAIPLTTYHFDKKAMHIQEDVLFPCGQVALLSEGLWHLA